MMMPTQNTHQNITSEWTDVRVRAMPSTTSAAPRRALTKLNHLSLSLRRAHSPRRMTPTPAAINIQAVSCSTPGTRTAQYTSAMPSTVLRIFAIMNAAPRGGGGSRESAKSAAESASTQRTLPATRPSTRGRAQSSRAIRSSFQAARTQRPRRTRARDSCAAAQGSTTLRSTPRATRTHRAAEQRSTSAQRSYRASRHARRHRLGCHALLSNGEQVVHQDHVACSKDEAEYQAHHDALDKPDVGLSFDERLQGGTAHGALVERLGNARNQQCPDHTDHAEIQQRERPFPARAVQLLRAPCFRQREVDHGDDATAIGAPEGEVAV